MAMDPLFVLLHSLPETGKVKLIGIYSSKGQLYEPVDNNTLSYYHEAKDGQILEEGITEAGSMASFISAGTSYANLGVNLIPFFIRGAPRSRDARPIIALDLAGAQLAGARAGGGQDVVHQEP